MSARAKDYSFGSSGPKGGQQESNPERQFKLKEVCDLLLAAGYHRARVTALTPFDRVVGGMVWAMTNSNFDVDIDILFTENATIGQRIKLADVLTRVLVKVKCPYALQSHQIQGLDYDRLFPVVQWLVKRAMETRRETGDLTRLQSISQFDKSYALPGDRASAESTAFISGVADTYKPKRKFKKRDAATFDSVTARTEATLLEYGEKIVSAAATTDAESADKRAAAKQLRGPSKLLEEKEAAAQKAEEEARAKKLAEHEARIKELQKTLEAGGDLAKVSGAVTGNLIAVSADLIKQSRADADAAAADAAAEMGGLGGGKAVSWQVAADRQKAILNEKIAAQEKKTAAKRAELEAQKQRAGALRAALEAKISAKDGLLTEANRLEALENSSANAPLLQKLKALVMLNETLKAQEAQFKLNCKQQRSELMDMIKRLDDFESGDEETKRMREVEKLYAADLDKVTRQRQALATKLRQCNTLARQIDEIPTRAELLQYERRFVELYELVAAKLKETKKYFDLYNTLSESHKHMSTEVSVLNSITEQFPKAMKSQKGKESFLESFKDIITGIQRTSDLADKDLSGEVAMREILNNKHNSLVEKQRAYFKSVKEFQEECFKNEKLTESVERFERALEQGGGEEGEGAPASAAADD